MIHNVFYETYSLNIHDLTEFNIFSTMSLQIDSKIICVRGTEDHDFCLPYGLRC